MLYLTVVVIMLSTSSWPANIIQCTFQLVITTSKLLAFYSTMICMTLWPWLKWVKQCKWNSSGTVQQSVLKWRYMHGKYICSQSTNCLLNFIQSKKYENWQKYMSWIWTMSGEVLTNKITTDSIDGVDLKCIGHISRRKRCYWHSLGTGKTGNMVRSYFSNTSIL